jgi:hypothetical protein
MSLLRESLATQVALERLQGEKKPQKKALKEATSTRDKASADAQAASAASTSCWNALKGQTGPALDAAAPSAVARQEAWTAWVASLKKGAPKP